MRFRPIEVQETSLENSVSAGKRCDQFPATWNLPTASAFAREDSFSGDWRRQVGLRDAQQPLSTIKIKLSGEVLRRSQQEECHLSSPEVNREIQCRIMCLCIPHMQTVLYPQECDKPSWNLKCSGCQLSEIWSLICGQKGIHLQKNIHVWNIKSQNFSDTTMYPTWYFMKCYYTSANFAGQHRIHCISICKELSETFFHAWYTIQYNIPFLYLRRRKRLPTENQVTKLSLQIFLKYTSNQTACQQDFSY